MADRTTSLTSPGGPLLIDAKLRAPLPREGTVPRPDLIKFLNAGSRCKLTLLSAPTGFGKTTLLTQWRAAEEDNRPFAWVTLDAGDQDPIRLCVYVVEAIDRVQPGFGDGMWRLLRTSGVDFKSTVLPRLVNELASLPRRIVVVFDDYHSLERGWADNPTNFVLEHLPDTVQFVISSRTEPSVPLGRLRASGQLAEIRAVDLAFGEEEAGVLLRATLGPSSTEKTWRS